MRILSIDFEPLFGAAEDTVTHFGSDVSVFDYDLVIWDPEVSFAHYLYPSSEYMGLPSLSDSQSSAVKADSSRRRSEFKEFIEAGRTMIVIVRDPQICYVQTGRSEYSGTGRNARRTNFVDSFDLLNALPVTNPDFQKAGGNRIEPVGDGPIQSLIRKYKDRLVYTGTMASPPGSVVAKITGTTRNVASYRKFKSGGVLLMMPAANFERKTKSDGSPGAWPREATEYQADLIEAIEGLSGTSELSRPSWADDYSTSEQRDVRDAVAKQRSTVERARAKLVGLQSDADSAELKDQLFLATGRQLELRVRDVLEQLGGEVTEPEPGRDDWKVTFDKKPVVVEVKGVSKSAAEKHAAQLEKWVAGSMEETGTLPKGLLVVNTWRETPLAERTEEDFPAQMIPYCESRGHCLVTGLELFVISSEIDRDATQAAVWRKKILSTSGRLTGVPDWRTYIQQSPDTTEQEAES